MFALDALQWLQSNCSWAVHQSVQLVREIGQVARMRNGIEDQALVAGALFGNALAGYADDVVARLEELVADGFANPT